MINIKSIKTVVPGKPVRQDTSCTLLSGSFGYDGMAEKIFENTKILSRHFVLHPIQWRTTSWQRLCEIYKERSVELSVDAGERLLKKGDIGNVGCMVFASCTGYMAPPPSFYIASGLGLNTNVRHQNLLGHGCSAFIPALKAGHDYIKANENKNRSSFKTTAIVIATELYSTCYSREATVEGIICNAIFGDASVAALVGNGHDGISIVDFECETVNEQAKILGLDWKKGELSVVLGKEVPTVGGDISKRVVEKMLKRNRLKISDIDSWIVHCGGTRVLNSVQETFNLTDENMEASWSIYERYGNTSSTSVGFVLESIWDKIEGYGIMLSFGPGFTCETALLKK